MNYYQIDSKNINSSKYEMPHTIEIVNDETLKYIESKDSDIEVFLQNQSNFYAEFPDISLGNLIDRDDVVDYMDVSPHCSSIKAVVSNKVKKILESLSVNPIEYALKEIRIKGFHDHFYLLFVPKILNKDYYFPECEFVDIFDESKKYTFKDVDEYNKNDNGFLTLKHICLNEKYKNYDLLYPREGSVFMSERLINELDNQKVIGFDVIRGGCFYETLKIHSNRSII